MSAYRRGKGWVARFQFKGEKVWVTGGPWETKGQAQEAERRCRDRLNARKTDETCASFADRWLEEWPRKQEATRRQYADAAKRFAKEFGPIVRGLCASDTHDPDDWHRAAPSTEVEGEAARGDEEWTIRQTDEWGLEQIAGPDFPGDETVVVPKARADHLQAERDTTDDLYQSIQAQLHAAVRGRGCPEGDICKRCPASEDDDACTPAERLIAERDSLSQQVSQLREALTRVAKFPAQYPDDMGGNGKMAVNSVNQSEIAAAALDGRELRWDCDPAPYENPRTALSDTERNHDD